MTEQELRMLVRQAISRAQGDSGGSTSGGTRPTPAFNLAAHGSHAMFVIPDGSDQDGPCMIEPAVSCNHCGYCKSLGH